MDQVRSDILGALNSLITYIQTHLLMKLNKRDPKPPIIVDFDHSTSQYVL